METNHREVLSSNMAKIADEIDVDDFLEELKKEGVLSEILIQDIISEKSRRAKAGKLVILLQSCGPKAFHRFKTQLKKNGFMDLAEKLENDVEELKTKEIKKSLRKIEKAGQIPMEAYGDILSLHQDEVVDDMWVEHVLPLMKKYPLDLSEDQLEEINKHTNRREKAETLFNMMKIRVDMDGKKTFDAFCDALAKVYPHLAHEIMKNEVKVMVAVSRPATKVEMVEDAVYSSPESSPRVDDSLQRKQVSFKSPRPRSTSPETDQRSTRYRKTPLPEIKSPIPTRTARSPTTDETGGSGRVTLPSLGENLAQLKDQLDSSVRDRYEKWLGLEAPDRGDPHLTQLDRATRLIIEANAAIEGLQAKIRDLQNERDEAMESRDEARNKNSSLLESLRQREKEKDAEIDKVHRLSEYLIRPRSTQGGLRRRRAPTQKFRPFSLRIRKSKTVDDIKEMVERKEGIPAEWQRFYYSGRPLKDFFTLREQNVYDQSQIDLRLEVPDGSMPIIIKTVDGETHVLAVEASETIAAVKSRIYDKLGIPPHQVRLVYGGMHLDNNRTLQEYGIENAATLHMVMRYHITVRTYNDKTVTLQVGESDTVKKIKMLVNEKIGVEPEMQRLMYSGNVLENQKSLLDYRIYEGSVLSLILTVTVVRKSRLDYDEDVYNIDLDPKDTVMKLKMKLEDSSGIEAERQHLVLDDVYLTNYDKVAPYAQKGKIITMYCDFIFVTWETGEVVLRNVRPQEVVGKVKSKIHELFSVQPPWIGFSCEHKELNVDSLTFDDYNVGDGAQVIFTLRAIPIQLLMQSGRVYKVNVYRKSTVKHVKAWIQDKVGIPKSKQRVHLNGEKLEDNDVFEDFKIDEHSVLYLK
ncbi:polyubiquitin-C-like [Ptychodera flava]|uniref:polyubiquitin-C-like n=1 Tax=Ptychodera flava TaxID=63121 RepID=UPI00396A42E9